MCSIYQTSIYYNKSRICGSSYVSNIRSLIGHGTDQLGVFLFPLTCRLVAALTNWECRFFPSLVDLWLRCDVFIPRFPHLVLPHLSQRPLQYWWLRHGIFITHFPRRVTRPHDDYIDRGAIIDNLYVSLTPRTRSGHPRSVRRHGFCWIARIIIN